MNEQIKSVYNVKYSTEQYHKYCKIEVFGDYLSELS